MYHKSQNTLRSRFYCVKKARRNSDSSDILSYDPLCNISSVTLAYKYKISSVVDSH